MKYEVEARFRRVYGTPNPIEAWEQAIQNLMKTGLDKHEAARRVMHDDPELRAEFVAAYNVKHADALHEINARRGR